MQLLQLTLKYNLSFADAVEKHTNWVEVSLEGLKIICSKAANMKMPEAG